MKRILSQLFLVLIVLLTLNSSVDIPDYLLYPSKADLANSNFNQIESLAELICEKVLDIHGLFPDLKDKSEGDHHRAKKITTVKFLYDNTGYSFTGFHLAEKNLLFPYKAHFTDFTAEIISPPPQFV